MSLTRRLSQALMIASMAAFPLFAQDGGEGVPPPQGGGSSFLFIMVAMVAIIYFIMIRPEQRRQKTRQAMLSALKKGDRILTLGGIMGVITAVKDNSYMIKSGEGTILEVSKSAIQSLIGDDAAKDAGAGESK